MLAFARLIESARSHLSDGVAALACARADYESSASSPFAALKRLRAAREPELRLDQDVPPAFVTAGTAFDVEAARLRLLRARPDAGRR
jgi:hypothetical protein